MPIDGKLPAAEASQPALPIALNRLPDGNTNTMSQDAEIADAGGMFVDGPADDGVNAVDDHAGVLEFPTGLQPFLQLERLDIFSWRLRQAIQNGENPDQVIEATVALILNEPHEVKRFRMAEAVAKVTGVPVQVIQDEVTRRKDEEGSRHRQELTLLAERTVKSIGKTPHAFVEIIREAQASAERIGAARRGYDLNQHYQYMDTIRELQEATLEKGGLKTGWPIFDSLFGGIPKQDAFISVPGKPNQGKSSSLTNLCWRLPENNPNVMCVMHTVDDAASVFIPRLFGSKYRIDSNIFMHAGYHLRNNTEVRLFRVERVPFREVFEQAWKWYKNLLLAEKLLVYDTSELPGDINALERRVAELRKRYPTSSIIVFADNFHLYENSASTNEKDAFVRELSMRFKRLGNDYHVTPIATMELPKSALLPGMRPRLHNIKGSGGISYDSNANIGIYNDLKDMRDDKAVLFWEEDCDPIEISPGRVVTRIKRPVLEFVFDKSKVNSGFDGNIYFEFHSSSGQILECSQEYQEIYARTAMAQQDRMANRRPSDRQTSPFEIRHQPAPDPHEQYLEIERQVRSQDPECPCA